MNLALIDPFQLAQDFPDSLRDQLRSGHASTLRFNRKGDYLACGRSDGKVVIYDLETMSVALKLHGHFKQVGSGIANCWSRCGRYLLSASQDCRVILWDLKTQERIAMVKFDAPIYIAEVSPVDKDIIIVSVFDDCPYLCDVSEKIPKKYKLPTIPLTDASVPSSDKKQSSTVAIFSTAGQHVIAGTSKGFINIIETESRKLIHSTKLSVGLITYVRLSSNGRSLLVNSTDRIIRVVNMPDLSFILPTTVEPEEDADPSTLAENIVLIVEHKFQDLVNRLSWNHATFSHSSANGSADYITASTYMRKDIYIWELSTNSLVRILENREEPAIIEWHPSRPLLAVTCVESGSIQIWGLEPQQKWSALAPDFAEVEENVEYVEREDEFDEFPAEEHRKRRLDREDEAVDIMTVEKTKGEEDESFVLPMIYDLSDSEDESLVRMGTGTMRKKEINEGKEWEDGSEPVTDNKASPAARPKKRAR